MHILAKAKPLAQRCQVGFPFCTYIFYSVSYGLQGKRFLQLKNPWSHLRWKGRYSEWDEKNWTPDLLKYLKFDPKTAQKFDNGERVSCSF